MLLWHLVVEAVDDVGQARIEHRVVIEVEEGVDARLGKDTNSGVWQRAVAQIAAAAAWERVVWTHRRGEANHRVHEQRDDERRVNVEHVQHEDTEAAVVLTAVDEEEAAEEAELADREIGVIHRLHPLLANDADADVPRLDHRDVVGAVANRETARPRHVVLDEAEHLRHVAQRT